ncbi:T9SS type A sorting domain-containing protein [Sediminibacterium soli]|uniref:T9SS type A sorting domain-containing protein n=1 Tax=Sediminibacterium soli TaxID=2698829 RepID=UPI00137AAEA8|nr:T9SS type A sorting domain-containing protein [Sediminibacterium soli]NCI45715.1 T9SS type A sorting domain-containing protein [Sediminibacterium soli]
MRKLYLACLLVFPLFLNSYVSDNTSPFTDGAKVTHFYPNPATSFINFTFDKSVDKTYSLQVYNFIGRKMTEMKITDGKLTITLDDNYLRGLYIYQLRDASSRIVESGKFQVSK